MADNFNGVDTHVAHRDIRLVAISRAPFETLNAYRERMGKLRRAIATLVPGASTCQSQQPSAIERDADEPLSPWTRRKRMAWAKLLARVFAIDVTVGADPS